jgi:predicted small secreted protein
MKKTAIVMLLIIAAVVLAGCTTTPAVGHDAARETIRAHYEYHEDWSPGYGCYEKVSGYAYNAGNTTVDTVILNLNLVNIPTGTIRDSRSVFAGSMDAGQSVTFEMVLDGECTQDYRVDGILVK